MEGIVYKQQSYLENDRLLFVYTKLGRITLVAKGSQKMTSNIRNVAQYLNLIYFKEVPQKNMYALIEGKTLNDFQNIKSSFDLMTQASILFDLIGFVADNDDHESIYTLLEGALLHFSKESILSFGFKLLSYLGYQISLKPDGRRVKGVNIKTASIVYEKEPYVANIDVHQTTLLVRLTYLEYDKIDAIDEINYRELKEFMYAYYEYHTDHKLTRK